MGSGFFKLLKALGEVADAFDKASKAQQSDNPAGARRQGQRTAETLERVFEEFVTSRASEMDAKGRDSSRRKRKETERAARSAFYDLERARGEALRKVYVAEFHADHPIRKKYEAVARRLQMQHNLLRIEPEREPLLDRAVADQEFKAAREHPKAVITQVGLRGHPNADAGSFGYPGSGALGSIRPSSRRLRQNSAGTLSSMAA